jgi:hypothetical protein
MFTEVDDVSEHPPIATTTVYTPLLVGVAPANVGESVVAVNPPGPDHVYVAPATVPVVNKRLSPSHNGLLLEGFAVGIELTVTGTDELVKHDPAVTVTVYVPVLAAVTPFTKGFCNEEVNPPGPVHE